jgi:uncharacterized Zn-binding protein involved in type VI secretion
MPAAARIGDMTSHGTPLTPPAPPGASIDVLIGNQPAWRAGDLHVCPLVSGTVPHSVGAVALGSTTVLINGLPAARMGDKIVETGPTNAIAAGCLTVLIGG